MSILSKFLIAQPLTDLEMNAAICLTMMRYDYGDNQEDRFDRFETIYKQVQEEVMAQQAASGLVALNAEDDRTAVQLEQKLQEEVTETEKPINKRRKTKSPKSRKPKLAGKSTRAKTPAQTAKIVTTAESPKIKIKFRLPPTPPDSSENALELKRSASVSTISESAPLFPSIERSPSTVSRSRKRKHEGEDATPKPGKKMRKPVDITKTSPRDRFSRVIKLLLNNRTGDNKDYSKFEVDALKFCPADGGGTEKHAEEVALASKLFGTRKHPMNVYRTQKYRMLIGAALLTEQNLRIQQQDDKPSLWHINTTRVQFMNNIDANANRDMLEQFKKWGWVPQSMFDTTKNKFDVEEFEIFPSAERKRLIDSLIAFEDDLYDEKFRVVRR